MVKAIWNGKVIAESNNTVVVENNHYFPPESINMKFLKKSGNKYTCAWKGVCDYYNIKVDDELNEDAAWMYPEPTEAAKSIKGRFAFWKGVKVE
ncbi:DUF427 domain-containing protein [Candidatus Woesearchaeota archaeon]|nr:DUF427 domain-containing protein [Candidatus Woesearchaeota archaeon]